MPDTKNAILNPDLTRKAWGLFNQALNSYYRWYNQRDVVNSEDYDIVKVEAVEAPSDNSKLVLKSIIFMDDQYVEIIVDTESSKVKIDRFDKAHSTEIDLDNMEG